MSLADIASADDIPALVLLSGVPGTGKSTFGRWAEREHGVVNIDVEQGGFDRFGLTSAWHAVCVFPPPDVMSFVRELQRFGRPVLMDWGFPPAVLPLVRALHDAGLRAWWFDGDRAASRNAFIHRDTVSLDALDTQMLAIGSHQHLLDAFYEDRVIWAIESDGTFAPAQVIFERLFGETA